MFVDIALSNLRESLTLKKSLKDLKSLSFWVDVSSEFVVSTFMMIAIIIIQITNDENIYKPNTTHIGLFSSIFVFVLLEAWGAISCLAHPPITFCLFIAGKMSIARALIYTLAQVVGCAAGSGIGYALTPVAKQGTFMAANPLDNGLTIVQAIFVEAIFTFNLIFVILSTLGSEFPRKYPILPHLAIGCAMGTATMAAGTYSGGFMNPLITLGLAILSHDFTYHWIYWVGPYLGGVPAVGLFKFYAWAKKRETKGQPRQPLPSEEQEFVRHKK